MTETPLLQLRNITKSFGSVQALTEVDFEVRHGEVMALVGDNGAGKSTLIKCVAGTHSAHWLTSLCSVSCESTSKMITAPRPSFV